MGTRIIIMGRVGMIMRMRIEDRGWRKAGARRDDGLLFWWSYFLGWVKL